MFSEVPDCRLQSFYVVSKATETSIAAVAKELPDLTGSVVVVDVQSLSLGVFLAGRLFADGAESTLFTLHCLVVFERNTIEQFKTAAPMCLRMDLIPQASTCL